MCRNVDDRDLAVVGDRREHDSVPRQDRSAWLAIQHQVSEYTSSFRIGKDHVMAYAIHDHDLAGRGFHHGAVWLRTRWNFAKYLAGAAIEDHCLGKATIRG